MICQSSVQLGLAIVVLLNILHLLILYLIFKERLWWAFFIFSVFAFISFVWLSPLMMNWLSWVC